MCLIRIARPKIMVKQMIHKMYLIVNVHKSLLENVEQLQKKQKMVYVVCKGLQTLKKMDLKKITRSRCVDLAKRGL
jgi:phosphoribosylformylglycinamidine (FGAM) synthase-like amidotransferase family enzyme